MTYSDLPAESLGPPNTSFSAPTCALLRQVSVLAPEHCSTAGLNLQALVFCTRPSTTPSPASQACSTALDTRFRSLSLKARDNTGLPSAPAGAMSVNFLLFHIAATVAPLDTRMAGAPAVMPSK